VRRRCLRVEITASRALYTLVEGEPLEISHYGEPVTVSRGTVQTRPIEPPAALPDAPQPPGRPLRRRS
jgi:alpha,alpha-trehalose phosphorylase